LALPLSSLFVPWQDVTAGTPLVTFAEKAKRSTRHGMGCHVKHFFFIANHWKVSDWMFSGDVLSNMASILPGDWRNVMEWQSFLERRSL
jgi:hypothetical protein